jgi:hypothetical protein
VDSKIERGKDRGKMRIHRFRRLHRLEKTKIKEFEAGFIAVLGMTYEEVLAGGVSEIRAICRICG